VRDVIGSECIGLQDLQSIIEIDTPALLMAICVCQSIVVGCWNPQLEYLFLNL
jgi:hypothetical protein